MLIKKIRWLTLILLLTLLLPARAQDDADTTPISERDYLIFVPFSAALDEEPLPLVIALHGFGDSARNFAAVTGLQPLAERFNFMVAYPQGILNQWNDGSLGDHYEDDVAYFQQMIDEIAAEYPLDRERVYLVGFSNGGTMVYRAACEAPGVFAGIAAIGGTMRTRQTCDGEDVALPILMLHGTADTVVSFEGNEDRYSVPQAFDLWTEINGCNPDEITQYQSDNFDNRIGFYYVTDCPNANHVLMYVIEEMPHTWPGAYEYSRGQHPPGRLDTARLIWGFFVEAHNARLAEAQSTDG